MYTFTFTNQFSGPSLRQRIGMINGRRSGTLAWMRYIVFFIVAVTVASAFAHPQEIKSLSKYVPKPVTKTISAVTEPQNEAVEPIVNDKHLVLSKTTELKPNRSLTSKALIQSTELSEDSVYNPPATTPIRVSPSRYITYEGNYLYWIITPKTTFDDFAIIKQEFIKHGYIMQLNEVKYDPLYAYIDKIMFSVVRPSGSRTRCDELEDDNKPIPTISGYFGIGSQAGNAGTGRLSSSDHIPQSLKKVAADDETAVVEFIKDKKMEYKVQEGEHKFKGLGNGSATYPKEFFKNKSTRSSGLVVLLDGSLSVDERLGEIKVFINNEPVEREAVSIWKVSQLYAVVEKYQYNPARKESFTSALLIYTTED